MEYLTEQDIEVIDTRCSLASLGDEYVERHRKEVSKKVDAFVADSRYGLSCSKLTEWMHHGIQFIMNSDEALPTRLNSPRRIIGIVAEGHEDEGKIILSDVRDKVKPSYHWLRELTEVQIAIVLREHKEHLEDDAEYAGYCERTNTKICPWGDEALVLIRKWLYETSPYTLWHMYEKCRYIMEDHLYADGLFTDIAMGFTDNVSVMTDAVSSHRERQMNQWMKDNV